MVKKNKNWNIFIPIETTKRELLSKLVLSNYLIQNGFTCYLGTKQEIYSLFKLVSPFIYLDKGYHYEVSEKIYKNIKKYNGLIANLDEEGGVDYKDSRNLLVRYPKKAMQNYDVSFLWGKYQYDILKENNRINESSNVIITGHPRFQLLDKNYHYLYLDEVNEIIKDYGNFILIATNMSLANNIKGNKFIHQNYIKREGNFLNKIIKYENEKIDIIVKATIKISKSLNKKIIFRPHPEENKRTYEEYFKNEKNIFIVSNKSVIPWIIASEMVIHPDCTTGVESALIGKPTLSLLPYYDNELTTEVPIRVSHQFFEIDKLYHFIKQKYYIDNEPLDKEEYLQLYFSKNGNALHNIANSITQLKNKDMKYYNYIFILYYKVKYYLRLISFLFLEKNKIDFRNQKKEGLNLKNINKIMNSISIKQIDKKIKVRQLNPDLFRIS